MNNVSKAREIKNAKISFVSLVDKAANKREFLITKAQDGMADWEATGRIIKTDNENHYITGVVYEPMTEDTQGDFMSAEVIEKTAHDFLKNGEGCDLQHNFKLQEGVSVVESWIAKADFEIDGEKVTKGTWLMTAEISDKNLWDKIQKGEITGFSMGGKGTYGDEDVDLDSIGKGEKEEKVNFLVKMAKFLGLKEDIEKGKVKGNYNARAKGDLFNEAWNALNRTLSKYNYVDDKWEFEDEEFVIREALSDFNDIVSDILLNEKYIAKSVKPTSEAVAKSGKKMSGKNRETLNGIYESLGTFLKEFDDPEPDENTNNNNDKEENDMTKDDIQKMVNEAVQKAMTAANSDTEPVAKSEDNTKNEPITAEKIQKMVTEAVQKAMTPDTKEEPLTAENVAKMVGEAVEKAVEPIRKHAGLPTNLNGAENSVAKSEEHYLHGFL